MGNCFKSSSSDGFSMLQGGSEDVDYSESSVVGTIPRGAGPPPYQVNRGQSTTSEDHHRVLHQPVTQLTEDEQIRIAKRIGLINHLPIGIYDGSKKTRECVICMGEFVEGDCIRYLPCLHTYHKDCIDDWMMRSFTCPSCMEPIDAALLMLYHTS